MGLLDLLNSGKSLVGLTDKLVTKVPLGEVVPNFSTRPGATARVAEARRRRGEREAFDGERRPAVRVGGPKIRSTVAPDPKLPKNPFSKPAVKRRQPKTDESLSVQEQVSVAPVLTPDFVPPSVAKRWAARLRAVRDTVKRPVVRKLKVPARLAQVFSQPVAAVRRRTPRGPLAARAQMIAA